MRHPFAIVDFEASSLALESFPIEVGVAVVWNDGDPIRVWSTLISPAAEWGTLEWDRQAESVHGIGKSKLASGASPTAVAEILNRLLAPLGRAWCDGGPYDVHWLRTLFRAAGARPLFQLWDIEAMFLMDRGFKNRFAAALSQSAPPHRAGGDAARIAKGILEAVGALSPQIVYVGSEEELRFPL